MRLFLSILLTALLGLSAEAQLFKKANPVKPKPNTVPAAAAPTNEKRGAKFRPGDVFTMRVAGIPTEEQGTFALEFTIGGDGTINVPLCGQVRAVGLTQGQLERAIEASLVEAKIFTNPTVIINVPLQGRYVTVGGQVRVPQRMPWTTDLTLMTAITAAGGPAEFAGRKVRLVRSGEVTVYDKRDLDKSPEKDPGLLPGDQLEHM